MMHDVPVESSPTQRSESSSAYAIKTLLLLVIALPLVLQAVLAIAVIIGIGVKISNVASYILFVIAIAMTGLIGYWYARHATLPTTFTARYLPLLTPVLVTCVVWTVGVYLNGGDLSQMRHSRANLIFLPYFAVLFFTMLGSPIWYLPVASTLLYCSFILFFMLGSRYQKLDNYRGRTTVCASLIALVSVLVWQVTHNQSTLVNDTMSGESLSEEVDLKIYRPFAPDNQLVRVHPPPALRFNKDDAPRLDGATALYPVYAAAGQALYAPELVDTKIRSSKTGEAYRRLIEGKVDLIFVAQASQAHIQMAQKNGVPLKLTPIAKEAFVFLVNESNPVRNLTTEQLRGLYAGRINDWSELGGNKGSITAFQRPANSGSQTVMEASVMQGEKMRLPLQEEKVSGMGGLVRQVASYRNAVQAIGYSFRYYTTRMKNQRTIRLLSINGVAPIQENVRNGTYPFSVELYMVTAGEPKPEVRKLMDWMLSAQGKKLIEDTGYMANP
jgi:phosphate transport system substrate-binding protein